MTERGPVWDAHSCLPIEAGVTFSNIDRHRAAGFDFVSINISMDPTPLEDTLRALAWFRNRILAEPGRYILAATTADVRTAANGGRLAIAFDIEGAGCLCGRAETLALYAALGVRQIHLAYNLGNAYAGGCYDAVDEGLTPLGREVVRTANASGVVVDCSHTGRRSSFEVMEASARPVVFSHANPAALVDLPRNITDDQIRACAATGGVVGVCAYARFLGGANDAAAMARHVDHVASLVGVDHVGFGWDHTYPDEGVPLARDEATFLRYFPDAAANRGAGLAGDDAHVPLEERAGLGDELSGMGYSPEDIAKVMGGNFLRVADACWPAGRP